MFIVATKIFLFSNRTSKREVLAAREREERDEREGKPRRGGIPESMLLVLERELKIM